jgi:hypothetical protein
VVAAELECDDWAVARTGRPLGLARSLARVAEWSISGARVNAEIALAQGGPRHLSDRVRRILSPAGPEGRGSRWGRVAAALLVLAPAFMLPSVPGAPVVRTAVLYRQQMEDGSGPAFLLLNAVTELGELPADLGAGPFDAETESADRPGG